VLVMAMAGGVMAHFEIAPARPGPNRIGVTLVPQSLAPKEVWLDLSQPEAGVGPLRRRLEPDGAGGWQIESSDLAIPGRWTLRLELLLSDYDQTSLSTELDLQ
jgi:copper transport protein